MFYGAVYQRRPRSVGTIDLQLETLYAQPFYIDITLFFFVLMSVFQTNQLIQHCQMDMFVTKTVGVHLVLLVCEMQSTVIFKHRSRQAVVCLTCQIKFQVDIVVLGIFCFTGGLSVIYLPHFQRISTLWICASAKFLIYPQKRRFHVCTIKK